MLCYWVDGATGFPVPRTIPDFHCVTPNGFACPLLILGSHLLTSGYGGYSSAPILVPFSSEEDEEELPAVEIDGSSCSPTS